MIERTKFRKGLIAEIGLGHHRPYSQKTSRLLVPRQRNLGLDVVSCALEKALPMLSEEIQRIVIEKTNHWNHQLSFWVNVDRDWIPKKKKEVLNIQLKKVALKRGIVFSFSLLDSSSTLDFQKCRK